MEEILIPVGSLKIEESSSEGREHKEGKGEKRKPRVDKPKESNETSPQEQGEASPKPARRSTVEISSSMSRRIQEDVG